MSMLSYSIWTKNFKCFQTLSPYLAGSLGRTREDILAGNLVYDPQVTYLSLLVGDGDNIAFMRGGRRGWMRDRLAYCQEQVIKSLRSY